MMKYICVVLLAIATIQAEEIEPKSEELKTEEMKTEDTVGLVKSWGYRYAPVGLRVVSAVEPLAYIHPKLTTLDTVKYEPVKVGSVESEHLAYERIHPFSRYIAYEPYQPILYRGHPSF